ncbi:hypothetical protein J5TS2_40730 [Brevibacillus halotolerans]|nr:hypothetical protein [Brevibacillus halotolerans]GIO03405.1 hypothetical protein J5TS2_40730 [Brevibacillus halotolerans]
MKKFLAITFTVMMVMAVSGAVSAANKDKPYCPNPKYPDTCILP